MANEVAKNINGGVDLSNEDINCLRIIGEWLKKQFHLPQNISDKELLQFLRCSGYSIEKTKLVIDSYCTIRTHTEFFHNRDPESTKVKQVTEYVHILKLDGITTTGANIIMIVLVNPDPTLYDFLQSTRYAFALMDLFTEENDRRLDYAFIFDLKGITLGHFAKFAANLNSVKNGIEYLQDGLPFNLKGFHFINMNPVIDTIMTFLKPLMRSYLFQMFQFYKPENFDKFYSIFPKKILPKEYGGDAPSTKELSDRDYNKFLKGSEILKRKELQVANEKLRDGPSRYQDSLGLQGSFKKLDLD